MTSTFATRPIRPPRPVRLDPQVRADAAHRMGMARHEIVNVVDTDAGCVIVTHDGMRMIDVPADKPDGLGRTGLLAYMRADGSPATGFNAYVPPDGSVHRAPPVEPQRAEPWTVEDLDYAADGIRSMPAPSGGPNGPTWAEWVGADPVRARKVWTHMAHRNGVRLVDAPTMFPEVAAVRVVIIESGWLAADELDRL